ncbi:MAG: hypothetical protein LUC93_16135 [Planctomycetaceae bacterium]|nr:hypothetical protein [Planctomycetaceae bacterium]
MQTELDTPVATGRKSFAARDRILLYLTGLDLGDLLSLELAGECLRRAGPDADAATAMAILHDMLRERGVGGHGHTPSSRLHSYPGMNRKAMVSKKMAGFSLVGSARKLAARVMGRKRGA